MAKGTEIVVSSQHRGVEQECIVSGTPKPGTVMQIKAATEPVGGAYTYEAYDKSYDAMPDAVAVLLPDRYQGKLETEAYTSGDRGFIYFPAAGEELNMIIENVAGTADDYAIGDRLEINDGTGKLQDASTSTLNNRRAPFTVLETITDPTDDYLAHVRFNGHGG